MAKPTTPKAAKNTATKPKGRTLSREALAAMREKFAYLYIGEAGGNGVMAYKMAGYTGASANVRASELLKHPEVAAIIDAHREKMRDQYEITADRVKRELALLAFSNTLDYGHVTPGGGFAIDLTQTTRDQFAAISEITTKHIPGKDGEQAVIETKIKTASKDASLEKLAKILGLYKDQGDTHLHVSFVVERTGRSKRGHLEG